MRPDDDSADDADHILQQAARRGLGPRPRLRYFAALAWCSFLGAVAMMAVWLFLEPEWHDAPLSFQRLAVTFALCLGLAALPAWMMMLLCAPNERERR